MVYIYVFSTLLFLNVNSQLLEKDYSPLLDVTSPSNPGIYLRLMPTGLAYLREIGVKVVNEQILHLSLPTIRERIENGEVSIYGAHISKYWPPQEYSLDLIEPNMFQWAMSKMHIRAGGEFQASLVNPLLPTVPIIGYFEVLLGHVALMISVQLERYTSGSPQVRSAHCQSAIGYVDLNVRNTGVITDFFINAFKAFVIANFKPQVEHRMCSMIESIINQDMNRILSTMPLKVRINENNLNIIGQTFGIVKPKSIIGQNGLRNFTLIHFVENLREQNLLLDYHLTVDPFVQNGAIAILARGEISWRGNGGTPFNPPNVKIPFPHGVHMAEFFATDYIANSMLYHAYRQHLMDVVVGPESSPQLKDLLFTSCSSTFCIGEHLGTLGEQYPDREVEIVFTARRAPLIVFIENRARFRLHGRMNMYVRPSNETQVKEMIIRSDTTMTANVNMWLNGTRIIGNATIENLDFRLLETKIKDVDQASFGDLGLFGAEFLEKLLTEILQLGITMPTMLGVQLKSPRLTFHERYLRVQTYFKLDERFTSDLFQKAVRETLSHVG
ncbi:unnamed protein product [Angiostrongylus costaricensis]|uniref:BPI1 domain-containing protein n=1 Tax=Angiostrongylus costaricensis TaxID=334426 RepID=A0A158PJJ3_ANGCS|nr:unnamed protein product [Angiostrongylus costaricensis]